MTKIIGIVVALFGAIMFGPPASALSSFTCTFGEGGTPCHQPKGQTCQHRFRARIFATCGNLEDAMVCMFTRTEEASIPDRAALMRRQRTVGYAFAIDDPGDGKMTLAYRQFSVTCDIAQ
jgi:hypothetical protein